jgi:hypothetical protein
MLTYLSCRKGTLNDCRNSVSDCQQVVGQFKGLFVTTVQISVASLCALRYQRNSVISVFTAQSEKC